MKIIQLNAITVNAIIARENGEEDWQPAEAWTEFVEVEQKFGNFIMGRETYELVTKLYKDHNFDEVDVPYKIIVTTNVHYAAPDGYVVVHSPEKAIEFLQSKGVETGLLVGGGKLNSSFYAKGLVNETWVTVSPFILGQGRPFISRAEFEVKLKLKDVIRLSKDRVQLKYSVIR